MVLQTCLPKPVTKNVLMVVFHCNFGAAVNPSLLVYPFLGHRRRG